MKKVNQRKNLFHTSEISPTERAQLLWDLGEVSVRLQDLYSVFEALIAREENWTEAAAETVDTLRSRQDKITSAGQVRIRDEERKRREKRVIKGKKS